MRIFVPRRLTVFVKNMHSLDQSRILEIRLWLRPNVNWTRACGFVLRLGLGLHRQVLKLTVIVLPNGFGQRGLDNISEKKNPQAEHGGDPGGILRAYYVFTARQHSWLC